MSLILSFENRSQVLVILNFEIAFKNNLTNSLSFSVNLSKNLNNLCMLVHQARLWLSTAIVMFLSYVQYNCTLQFVYYKLSVLHTADPTDNNDTATAAVMQSSINFYFK